MDANSNRQSGRSRLWLRRAAALGSVLGLALAGLVTTGAGQGADAAPPPGEGVRELFSLTVGDQISYGGGDEQLAWGPAGIVLTGRGTLWIADGFGHRLLGFDLTGHSQGVVDLDDQVVGIDGLTAHGSRLVVLDSSAVQPRVVVVDSVTRQVVGGADLPAGVSLDTGLTGVTAAADGTVYAEMDFGVSYAPVARLTTVAGKALTPSAGAKTVRTVKLSAGAVGIDPGGSRNLDDRVQVALNRHSIAVETENSTGTVQILDSRPGRVLMMVDEVSQWASGEIVVDSVLRLHDADAELHGLARLPRSAIAIPRPALLSPDGRILALIAQPDRLSVVELTTTHTLVSALPDEAESERAITAWERSAALEATHEGTSAAPRNRGTSRVPDHA